MAANSATSVVDLDFDTIKSNLINFLKGQSSIQDYNFEGSNINTLLDVLSYNTYLNNFYTNMVANEMFLDTALIRESVISHAKELNYLPRSCTASSARINVRVYPTDQPSSINMDKYTKFTSTVGGKTFTFSTDSDVTIVATEVDGEAQYLASNVSVIEGQVITEYFTADGSNNFSAVISNEGVDTSNITVRVRESNTVSTNTEWSKTSTIFGINNESNSYFVEPTESFKYKISFGDGVFGRKPVNGNIIEVTYRSVSDAEANRASKFTSVSGVGGYSNVIITTVANSDGGADRESLVSIKQNAPRAFQVQERAVTSNDYEIIAKQQFPEIENIAAFGGQDSNPPRYGKVLLAVDLTQTDGVSLAKKQEIEEFINTRTPVGVDAIVVDPKFIFLSLKLTITYDIGASSDSPSTIGARGREALNNYAQVNLNGFNKKYRNSKALAAVDLTDGSIMGSETELNPYTIIPLSNTLRSYNLETLNELKEDSNLSTLTKVSTYEPAVESTTFNYLGDSAARFIDAGNGILAIVRGDTTFTFLKNNAGTINYKTGDITIKPITISEATGSLKMYFRPKNKDVMSVRDTILQLNDNDIEVIVNQGRS